MYSNPDILNKFMMIQDILNPDISIEIGAYDADFSKEMLRFDIDIFAFEASPYVYNKYKNEMGRVKYINLAVSDKNEKIKFEIQSELDPELTGSNSIKNRNENKDYDYVDVDSISIDSYFKNNDFKKAAVWVDVEGASGEVLIGAKEKIKDFASIYMELETMNFWSNSWKRNKVIKYLNDNGFYLFYEVEPWVGQTDAIFINNIYKEVIDEAISK